MATWRDHPYFSTVHVWLDAPTVIFRARVNQASFTYPAVAVLFDTVTTGAYTDIEVGMTVLFGSTAGADDLGRTYVKRPAGFNGFEFGRSEQGDHDGEVNLADNAYITILDDYRVYAKVPSISSGSGVRQTDGYRDFATYGKLPPMIVLDCGTAVQADVNSGTSKATFTLDASDSYPAESGATISSYSYTLPATAIVTSGAVNTSTVTFTTSQGVRWLKLDITDSNGTVSTRHVRLIAENEGNLTGWELQPWEYGDDGQTITLRLHGSAARATYPEGTGLYIWQKENYAGVEGSLAGPVGSEHMLFTGWLDTEAATTTPGERGVLSETTLKAIDVAGRMKQLMVVPISTGNEDDADSWDEMVDANPDKLMVRTLHEYSSVLTLCDFRWSGAGASYPFTRWDTSGGTLWDAVKGFAYAMGGGKYALTFDEWGRMAVPVDPMLVDSGSRTATVLAALGEGDWTGSLKAGRDRVARYRFMWGKSTAPSTGNASTTKTIASANAVAPGLAGGPGSKETTLSGFIAASTELVTLLKHAYERAASPDELYMIDLAHGGNIGISPAAKAWVTVTQSAANAAQRGWTLATARMLPTKVRVSYDGEHGLMTRSLTAEKETVGVAAVAFTPKQRIEYTIPRTITPPGLNYGGLIPPTPPPFGLPSVLKRLCLICDDGKLRRSLGPGSLPWDEVAPSGLGAGNWQTYCFKSNCDAATGAGTQVDGYVATDGTNAAYLLSDLFGTPAASVPSGLASVGARSYRAIDMSWADAGTDSVFLLEETSSGTKIRVSPNGGASFGSAINVGVQNGGVANFIQASARVSGKAFAGGWPAMPATSQYLYIITSNGSTVTQQTNVFIEDYYPPLFVPYHDPTEARIFTGWNTTGGNQGMYPVTNTLMRSTIDTGMVDIGAVVAGDSYGPDPLVSRFTMSSPNTEAAAGKRFMYVGTEKTRAKWGVFYTDDVEATTPTWTVVVEPSAGCLWRSCILLDPDGSTALLFGVNGSIGYWDSTTVIYWSQNLAGSTFTVLGVAA